MGITYADVLGYAFGEREFTASDVARITGNRRAAKLLSELKFRGILQRVGRGRYRFHNLNEKPDIRSAEWKRVKGLLLSAPWPKAWSGRIAVEKWTGGRYMTSPNVYMRIFEVAVESNRLVDWRKYLKVNGLSLQGRRRIGAVVMLKPTGNLRYVMLDGEPVITKEETLQIIVNDRATYANADDLFEDH